MHGDIMRQRNKKCTKKAECSFSDRLCRALDITPDILPGGSYVEIRGRGSLLIRGCRKILKYSREEIVIATCRDVFSVRGESLTCISYLAGAVGIEGRIDGVDFCSERREVK